MTLNKVSIFGILLLISSCGEGGLMGISSDDKNALPIVSVSLGMLVREVEEQSTAHVRFYNPVSQTTSDDFHENLPHQLKYVHPTMGFTLSGMEQISIQSFNGKVVAISDRPDSHLLTIDAVIDLSSLYAETIDRAGWKREIARTGNLYSFVPTRNYSSLEEIKRTFLDKSLIERLDRVKIASWKNGVDSIEINIDRKRYKTHVSDDWINEKEYLLTIEFSNIN